MKKIICFSLVLICLLSCSKDDDVDSSEYYVKYEVSCQFERYYGNYSGTKSIVINGTGSRRIEIKDKHSYSWSDVCGPFKKGDMVSLSVVTTTQKASDYNIDAKMSVCNESGPFATKRSLSAKGSVSLSYKIE